MNHGDTEPRSGRTVWFVGDLDDPWVASLAEVLPPGTHKVNCATELSEKVVLAGFEADTSVLVLHRMLFTRQDEAWLAGFRSRGAKPPRVLLCFGPHVRYAELERCSALFDVALPEATARDSIARYVSPGVDLSGQSMGRTLSAGMRRRLTIVSTDLALRKTLAEACDAAGYATTSARDWSEAPPGVPAVWEVPLLDPDWPQELGRRAKLVPVVTLLGFADRSIVAEARQRGATFCLESPIDIADLLSALGRIPFVPTSHSHEVPPPPLLLRRPAPSQSAAVAAHRRDA